MRLGNPTRWLRCPSCGADKELIVRADHFEYVSRCRKCPVVEKITYNPHTHFNYWPGRIKSRVELIDGHGGSW